MASLRGLIAILGITAFAGIGGLYVLEELCNGNTKNVKTVKLPEYTEEKAATTDTNTNTSTNVEPYTLNMDTVDTVDNQEEDKEDKEKVSKDTEARNKDNVVFDFHDFTDQEEDLGLMGDEQALV
jgi:hypothetical protein